MDLLIQFYLQCLRECHYPCLQSQKLPFCQLYFCVSLCFSSFYLLHSNRGGKRPKPGLPTPVSSNQSNVCYFLSFRVMHVFYQDKGFLLHTNKILGELGTTHMLPEPCHKCSMVQVYESVPTNFPRTTGGQYLVSRVPPTSAVFCAKTDDGFNPDKKLFEMMDSILIRALSSVAVSEPQPVKVPHSIFYLGNLTVTQRAPCEASPSGWGNRLQVACFQFLPVPNLYGMEALSTRVKINLSPSTNINISASSLGSPSLFYVLWSFSLFSTAMEREKNKRGHRCLGGHGREMLICTNTRRIYRQIYSRSTQTGLERFTEETLGRDLNHTQYPLGPAQ